MEALGKAVQISGSGTELHHTLLSVAAEKEHISIVEPPLDREVDIKAKDKH